MRFATLLLSVASLTVTGAAQTFSPAQSLFPNKAPQHVSGATAVSAAAAAPGATVMLWADVTPNPGVHVYAAGAKEFTPVAVKITPRRGITALAARYPRPDLSPARLAVDPAPAYYDAFRIEQPLKIAQTAKPGESIALDAVVTYQACDANLCYPVSTLPLTWMVTLK
jgi:DsbC/DsbD-like thiol-disulfide interchange protein